MVQAFPSVQPVPSPTSELAHCPLAGLHVEAWHWSIGVHTTGLPPVQVPFWQVSVSVHGFWSLQVVPLFAAGLLHIPVAGSQVPALWHWSLAVHTTWFAPVQVQPWQVSV
jgi:hypothetical protein